MQFSQVMSQFRERGEWLLSGEYERLAECYHYPLPVFLHQSRLVLTSPEHAVEVFRMLHAALLARGVVALRPKISAIDLPRAGRFRVWVDWQEIAFPADATRVSQAVYYCRETKLGLLSEMINYTHLSMPELSEQFAALALSA